jgi:SAM-dependent methyltransferase
MYCGNRYHDSGVELMGGELDWAAGVEHLRLADALSVALYREIAAWLAPGRESRVLDAGCGAGGMTVQLAQAVGPAGQVVAMDGEPAAVAATSSLVAEHGLADRVEVVVGELPAAAARAGPFDLIRASRVVHHLADEAAGVRALAASLRPAGRLALAEGGLPMGCLPFDTGVGEPGLEDRLAAAAARWFTTLRGGLPAATARHHGWTRVLADAGLVGVGTRSFLLEVGPPLDADQAAYVRGHLRDLLERLDGTLEESDRRALARLTDPSDPADLARRDDVFALGVQSIHVGTAPAPPSP